MGNFTSIVDTIENFVVLAQIEVTVVVMVVNLVLAFAIGLTIAFVYQKTHTGLSYSRPFLTTIVVLTILGSVVMMVVAQNFVGAFALLGAFALIRFRTILKETRDIAFVFFALVEGVAVGMSDYMVAVISTAFIVGVIFLLEKLRFGRVIQGGYLLTVIASEPFALGEEGEWEKYIRHYSTLHIKALGESRMEYMFDIALADPSRAHLLLSMVQKRSGVEHVELISGDSTAEY